MNPFGSSPILASTCKMRVDLRPPIFPNAVGCCRIVTIKQPAPCLLEPPVGFPSSIRVPLRTRLALSPKQLSLQDGLAVRLTCSTRSLPKCSQTWSGGSPADFSAVSHLSIESSVRSLPVAPGSVIFRLTRDAASSSGSTLAVRAMGEQRVLTALTDLPRFALMQAGNGFEIVS